MSTIKIIFAFIFAGSVISGMPQAQVKRDLIAMPQGDSLILFLSVPPESQGGFEVYRKGPLPQETEFRLLNKGNLIKPVIDADEARAIMGEDWEFICNSLKSTEPLVVLRKLQAGGFASGLLSLLSLNAAKVTGRYFLDDSVKSGNRYEYKILIYNGSRSLIDSVTKSITIKDIIPAPPSKLKAEVNDGYAKLTWDYPKWKNDFNDIAVQFNVYCSSGKGAFKKVNQKRILRDDNSPREFEDRWLENGMEYSYYITAANPAGKESPPSGIIKVKPVDKTPPEIVGNVTAGAKEGSVSLLWGLCVDMDAAGYNIYRSKLLNKNFEKLNKKFIPVDKPFFNDSTISNGVQYFYSITAVDQSGNESKKSNPVFAIGEDKTPPDAPTGLTFDVKKRILYLKWKPSKAKDIAGYYIYRGETKEIFPRIVTHLIKTASYVDSGYQGSGLTPGGRFVVGVSAVDGSNNESEKLIGEIKIADNERPLPPSSISLKNNDGNYIEVSTGTSPSLDVALYHLFRYENKKPVLICESHSAINKFVDTAIMKGKSYSYYVTAIDTSKNESEPIRDSVLARDFSSPPNTRNISASIINNGVRLEWERVIDYDFAGFNVYRSELPNGIFIKINSAPVKELNYFDKSGAQNSYYKILSLDSSGNESFQQEAVQPK